MDIELISFDTCPFVQRSIITLKYKRVPFHFKSIELDNPPSWFYELSPFGRVPILKMDNTHVLFEAAIINEFLDEITPGTLLPSDPVKKALHRNCIEFGSECLQDLAGLLHAQKAKVFANQHNQLCSKFLSLENILQNGRYFNDEELSLVDFAYAPLFMRIELLDLGDKLYPKQQFPKIYRWCHELLELDAVKESVPDDFAERLRIYISNKSPCAAQALFGELIC